MKKLFSLLLVLSLYLPYAAPARAQDVVANGALQVKSVRDVQVTASGTLSVSLAGISRLRLTPRAAGYSVTLPLPATSEQGKILYVENVGFVDLTVNTDALTSGKVAQYLATTVGGVLQWRPAASGGGGSVVDATTSVKGKAQLATDSDVTTGTDTAKITTPATVRKQRGKTRSIAFASLPTSTYTDGAPVEDGDQVRVTDMNRDIYTFNAALSRWISRNGQRYNVEDAGLVGDSNGTTGNGTDNRAALNTLLNTTIPANTKATVIFTPGRYRVASTFTSPPLVRLIFEPGASLVIDNCIPILKGQIEAAREHIFESVGTGHPTFGVNYGGNALDCTGGCNYNNMNGKPGHQRQRLFLPEWFGARGDWINAIQGTPDAAAFNKMFQVVPNGSYVQLDSNAAYLIEATLTLENRTIRFGGTTPVGKCNATGQNVASIIWGGATGGRVFQLNQLYHPTFEKFYVSGSDFSGGHSADNLFFFSNTLGSASSISSGIIFNDVTMYANSNRATFRAVKIGTGEVTGNNEHHEFNNCNIKGSLTDDINAGIPASIGVELGHSDVKSVVFSNTSITQCGYAIYQVGGSFKIRKGKIGQNNIDYYITSAHDTIAITDVDNEESRQLLVIGGGSNVPIEISNSRLSRNYDKLNVASATYPWIDASGGTLILNIHDNNLGPFWNATYPSNVYLLKGHSSGLGEVVWQRNLISDYPVTALHTNLRTFGKARMDDKYLAHPTAAAAAEGGGITGVLGSMPTVLAKVQGGSDEQPNSKTDCTVPSLCFAGGAYEVTGVPNPVITPGISVQGTPGSTAYDYAYVGIDANGNKTKASYPNRVTNGPATLNGTDFIRLTLYALPGAVSYDIIERNQANSTYRFVANTSSLTYDVQADPGTPYTYSRPGYNGTFTNWHRGTHIFSDAADYTKKITFDLADIGTGQNRAFKWPNISGTPTLATRTGSWVDDDCVKYSGGNFVSSSCVGGSFSLNGQTGGTQTFGNDANVTMVSSGNTHTLTWASTLAKARQHSATVYNDAANTFGNFTQFFGGTLKITSTTTPTGDGLELHKNDILSFNRTAGTRQPLTITASSLTVNLDTTANFGATNFANGISVQGSFVPSSGSGLEIAGGSTPFINSFNRTGSAWLPFDINASSIVFTPQSGTVGISGRTSSFPGLKRSSTTLQIRLADDSGDAPLSAGAGAFSGAVTVTGADFVAATAGRTIQVKTGTNACSGSSVLVGGTVTVSTTCTPATLGTNGIIILTSQVDGGTTGYLRISAYSGSTSFTITSSSGSDTSTIGWIIIKQN